MRMVRSAAAMDSTTGRRGAADGIPESHGRGVGRLGYLMSSPCRLTPSRSQPLDRLPLPFAFAALPNARSNLSMVATFDLRLPCSMRVGAVTSHGQWPALRSHVIGA